MTKLLGVEKPIMLAGMGGVSYHKLVTAVCEAGGFGCIGAGMITTEELVEEIRQVKNATSKPFGVDILGPLPNSKEMTTAAIENGARVLVTGLGIKPEIVQLCHDNGMLVGVMCGKVSHALNALKLGCDFVIAQGTEAGGHTGDIGLFALLPRIVDAVGHKIPVAAAGGIVDGRGMVAAWALGAEAIWVGTRFVATHEANTVPFYKEVLCKTQEDGTVVTRGYTGKPCRVIKNEWTDYILAHPEKQKPFPMMSMVAMKEGANHMGGDEKTEGVDPKREFFPCGQGVGSIRSVLSAATVIDNFMSQAIQLLSSLPRPSIHTPARL